MAHSEAELKSIGDKNILFEIILDRKRTGHMFTVGSLQHQHVIKTETCEYLDC
jgi:hypothetical protein